MTTAIERLTAWNEGDTLPDSYCPEGLEWQRDLRAVLKIATAARVLAAQDCDDYRFEQRLGELVEAVTAVVETDKP